MELVPIQSYYKHELCCFYECDLKTLQVWMKSIENSLEETNYNKYQKRLTIKQTQILFTKIGHPEYDPPAKLKDKDGI